MENSMEKFQTLLSEFTRLNGTGNHKRANTVLADILKLLIGSSADEKVAEQLEIEFPKEFSGSFRNPEVLPPEDFDDVNPVKSPSLADFKNLQSELTRARNDIGEIRCELHRMNEATKLSEKVIVNKDGLARKKPGPKPKSKEASE